MAAVFLSGTFFPPGRRTSEIQQPVGLPPQLCPEIRVGHGDEVFHPLAHRALAELGHAVLRDHQIG